MGRIQSRRSRKTAEPAKVLDLDLRHSHGPSYIERCNVLRAGRIGGSAAPAYSQATAVAAMEPVAKDMAANLRYSWTGSMLQQKQSGGQTY